MRKESADAIRYLQPRSVWSADDLLYQKHGLRLNQQDESEPRIMSVGRTLESLIATPNFRQERSKPPVVCVP